MPVTELESGKKEFEYATDNPNVARFSRLHALKNNYPRQNKWLTKYAIFPFKGRLSKPPPENLIAFQLVRSIALRHPRNKR